MHIDYGPSCVFSEFDSFTFLTQHLIGLKDAVKGCSLHWFFNEFPGGSQLTCSIIAAYLATIPDVDKKTVFIQLDNCSGENKNWLVLQFLSMLVGMGNVMRIEIIYLPVGHTHIDIDQVLFLFSYFSLSKSLHHNFLIPAVSVVIGILVHFESVES